MGGATETAQHLRAFVTFVEDLGLVLKIHMVGSQASRTSVSGELTPSFDL